MTNYDDKIATNKNSRRNFFSQLLNTITKYRSSTFRTSLFPLLSFFSRMLFLYTINVK